VSPKKPRRCAIYARLSQAAEESVSIERQVDACRALAEARGWEVVLVATDDGVSATKTKPEARPGWRQVRDAFPRLDAVVYWKTDRLVRRVSDFYRLSEEARDAGVALVSEQEPSLDLSTSQGRAFAGMLAIFAEMEADAISARVTAARAHLIREGRVAGGERPWPYEVVPRTEGPGLAWRPIPERAEAIRRAAAAIIAGEESASSVARLWDAAGLPPKSGTTWDPSSVRALLRRPVLYGATVHRGALVRNADRTARINPSRVILDRATWGDLQDALEARVTRRGARPIRLPLLHGLALCATCHGTLKAHRPGDPGRAARYVCQNRVCPARVAVSMDRLEEYVVEDFLGALGDRAVTTVERQTEPDAVALAEIEEALEAVEADLDATDDDEEAARLVRQRRTLRERLAELRDEAANGAGGGRPAVLSSTGETFAEAWADAEGDTAARRGLLERAFVGVLVSKGQRGRHGLDPARVRLLTSWDEEAAS
jgi:DNA invertase Pin-like site-specific DNA recombinase